MKQILFDEHQHWEAFKKKNGARIRHIIIKEVENFRNCGKILVCEGCHHTHLVPFRCKGCFCTTCSVGESEEWSRLLT